MLINREISRDNSKVQNGVFLYNFSDDTMIFKKFPDHLFNFFWKLFLKISR